MNQDTRLHITENLPKIYLRGSLAGPFPGRAKTEQLKETTRNKKPNLGTRNIFMLCSETKLSLTPKEIKKTHSQISWPLSHSPSLENSRKESKKIETTKKRVACLF